MTSADPLPTWNEGAAKTAIIDFLEAAQSVPVDERVAVFDNDGTLWCEKPNYVQAEFLLRELDAAVALDPALGDREEYRAMLAHDLPLQAELGLERIALALVELCAGIGPSEFDERVRTFFEGSVHRDRNVPYRAMRYAPMLELVDAVPALDPALLARAGVLTGEAAVTLGATDQGMVAGDLVNTAARIQSAAEPGTVLAGDTTRHATLSKPRPPPCSELRPSFVGSWYFVPSIAKLPPAMRLA
jgi:hypothetical protein